MKKNIFIIILLLILAIVLYSYGTRKGPVLNNNPVGGQPTTTQPVAYKDMIIVDSPRVGDKVISPITVSGKARGNWYFEASFPVQILDEEGNILGQAPAQAQGEWMTTDYVPFSATIPFQAPKNPSAKLLIKFNKDNPSGLPENDDFVSVEVNYK